MAQTAYHPLAVEQKEIRLLRLKPGLAASRPSCELEKVALLQNAVPDYEAVSYTWNNPNELGEIELHGQCFAVPKSAVTALQGLQLANKDRLLWIDAICIDQANRKERGEQVAMMGDIYKGASRTLIWLGKDDTGFVRSIKAVKAVLHDMYKRTNDLKQLKNVIYSKNSGLHHSSTSSRLERHLPYLIRLYRRPWFSRLWVVQEVAVSRSSTCICGRYELPWKDVARTAVWLGYIITQQHGTSRLDCPGIDSAAVMWQYSEREYGLYKQGEVPRLSLGNLLANARHFEASNLVDKVYGLLALTSWCGDGKPLPEDIRPDYGKSVAEVYRDATRLAMQQTQSLHILRYALTPEENQAHGFPTWVPRWDQRAKAHHSRPLPKIFLASGSRKVVLKPASDFNALELLGTLFDRVMKVSDILDDKACLSALDDATSLFSSHIGVTNLLPETYHTGESLRDSITLTAIAGAIQKRAETNAELVAKKNQLQRSRSLSRAALKDLTEARQACLNRRFLLTERGYIGLGPLGTRPDDIVVLLYGGRTPYVLRAERDYFVFLGECYVHGIMFGEAMRSEAGSKPQDFCFTIR